VTRTSLSRSKGQRRGGEYCGTSRTACFWGYLA